MHLRTAGTYACYIAGCRQPECVAAERRYQSERYRRIAYGQPLKVSSIGGVRRIQALMAIGWAGDYLATRLAIRRTNLPVHMRYPTMRTRTARAITAVYEELYLRAGPSSRTASRAEAQGFLPPECWEGMDMDDPEARPHQLWVDTPDLDEVAVILTLRGQRVHLNPAEREEAARRLLQAGLGPGPIGARLHMNGSEVRKLLDRLRATA